MCAESMPQTHHFYSNPNPDVCVLVCLSVRLCSGVAQLAEVLHGMPHLTALAIEGALLDADEDWLRDMAGLMRHGRWGVRGE